MSFRVDTVTVVFLSPSGERYEAKGRVGQNILEVAIENDVNIEGASVRWGLHRGASTHGARRG